MRRTLRSKEANTRCGVSFDVAVTLAGFSGCITVSTRSCWNWPADGGLRVTAWVFSPLIPPSRRGTVWAGLMHASDWLPTWVVGVAAQDPAVATGPRPLDGHSMWAAWTTENATSPRTEVIHQVVNTHCDENCTFDGKPAPCSVAPFGNTIRLGDYKALAGSPGPTNIVPFPAPGANPVEFGTHHAEGNNGSTVEPGTDHARAGGVGAGGWQGPATQHDCNPWCLYNVVVSCWWHALPPPPPPPRCVFLVCSMPQLLAI